jgi:hypothetical protein
MFSFPAMLPPISVLLTRSQEESYFNSTFLGIDIQLSVDNFKFSHDIKIIETVNEALSSMKHLILLILRISQ